MKIAIDLLWLRPSKVGGTESYIRNLIDGFIRLEDNFEFVLLVAKNTTDTFLKYANDERISILEVNIDNSNIGKRILWQFAYESSFLKKNGISHCFVPVYCRPIFNSGVQYINVIHDIQAYHHPEYHPYYEVWYSKLIWIANKMFSRRIICTSDYVKNDIVKIYKFNPDKVKVIPIPITINKEDIVDYKVINEKYGVEQYEYFYSVCQLIPHKNLKTLVEAFKIIRNDKGIGNIKLLISGVNGNAAEELKKQLKELGLNDVVMLTGFVDNNVRNTLYKYCKAFLFPSVFEGFGMPPLEAMYMGRPVLTTKCTSIPEVTQNQAEYVNDPYDAKEWCDRILNIDNTFNGEVDFNKYDAKRLAKVTLDYILETFGEK